MAALNHTTAKISQAVKKMCSTQEGNCEKHAKSKVATKKLL